MKRRRRPRPGSSISPPICKAGPPRRRRTIRVPHCHPPTWICSGWICANGAMVICSSLGKCDTTPRSSAPAWSCRAMSAICSSYPNRPIPIFCKSMRRWVKSYAINGFSPLRRACRGRGNPCNETTPLVMRRSQERPPSTSRSFTMPNTRLRPRIFVWAVVGPLRKFWGPGPRWWKILSSNVN